MFYFILRDCLVSRDLSEAVSIAYSRCSGGYLKVVTVDGKVVQESGAISGARLAKCDGCVLSSLY